MLQRIVILLHLFEIGTRIISIVNALVSEDYKLAVEEALHMVSAAWPYIVKLWSR